MKSYLNTGKIIAALALSVYGQCIYAQLQNEFLDTNRPDCKALKFPAQKSVQYTDWTGSCLDGFASGDGKLSVNLNDIPSVEINGTVVQGRFEGDAKLIWITKNPKPNSFRTLEGQYKAGLFHGKVIARRADGIVQELWGWTDGRLHTKEAFEAKNRQKKNSATSVEVKSEESIDAVLARNFAQLSNTGKLQKSGASEPSASVVDVNYEEVDYFDAELERKFQLCDGDKYCVANAIFDLQKLGSDNCTVDPEYYAYRSFKVVRGKCVGGKLQGWGVARPAEGVDVVAGYFRNGKLSSFGIFSFDQCANRHWFGGCQEKIYRAEGIGYFIENSLRYGCISPKNCSSVGEFYKFADARQCDKASMIFDSLPNSMKVKLKNRILDCRGQLIFLNYIRTNSPKFLYAKALEMQRRDARGEVGGRVYFAADLYNEIIDKYPSSKEAILARIQLKNDESRRVAAKAASDAAYAAKRRTVTSQRTGDYQIVSNKTESGQHLLLAKCTEGGYVTSYRRVGDSSSPVCWQFVDRRGTGCPIGATMESALRDACKALE